MEIPMSDFSRAGALLVLVLLGCGGEVSPAAPPRCEPCAPPAAATGRSDVSAATGTPDRVDRPLPAPAAAAPAPATRSRLEGFNCTDLKTGRGPLRGTRGTGPEGAHMDPGDIACSAVVIAGCEGSLDGVLRVGSKHLAEDFKHVKRPGAAIALDFRLPYHLWSKEVDPKTEMNMKRRHPRSTAIFRLQVYVACDAPTPDDEDLEDSFVVNFAGPLTWR
jgi:hypothetical protein